MTMVRGWSNEIGDWVYGTLVNDTTLEIDGDLCEIVSGSVAVKTNFIESYGDAIYVGDEGYLLFPTTASNPLFVGDNGFSSAYVKFVETDSGFDAAVRWKKGDEMSYLGFDLINSELADMGKKFQFALRHTEFELLNKVYTVSVGIELSDVVETDGVELIRYLGTDRLEFDLTGYEWDVKTVYGRVVDALIDMNVPVYREDGTTKLYASSDTMLSLTDVNGVHYSIKLGCTRDDDAEMEEYERSGIYHWFDLKFDVYANGECKLW